MTNRPDHRRNLRRRPLFCVENLEHRQLLSAAPNWAPAAKLINQDLAVANFPDLTGAGETVVIIDSGVDYRHPSLGGGIGDNYKVIAGYDFMSGDADPFPDTFAHGTGAAGVVAADAYTYKGYYNQGIAPGANLIALREGNSNQVKQSLDWVLANRAKYNIVAVNLVDYGGNAPSTYKDVFKKLVAAGVFIAHPSGNAGAAAGIASALVPEDYAVGSVNLSGAMSDFTQRGAELDLLAPGEKVLIPYYDVATKQHIYVDTADGTSWASPAVVGAAALIKQIDPRFTPAQVMSILQESGASVYDATTKLTYKRLDLNAALTLAYQRRNLVLEPPDAVGASAALPQTPFGGAAPAIDADATIQAEAYDEGGEGVAYHDTEAAAAANVNAYRPADGVDVESSVGGGKDVGYVRPGEWLEYTVDVASAGTYTLAARVASLRAGGTFRLTVDGVDKTGALAVPNSGGWQNWTTVSKSGVTLAAGTHVLRLQADTAGALGYVGNFDSFQFTRDVRTATQPITAASFDRQSGVAVSSSAATGDYLAYLEQGDYAAYDDVAFGSAGATTMTAELAALTGWAGKKIQVRLGSPTGTVIGTLTVPDTGSWTTFQTQKISITKTTGVQDVYLTFAGASWIGNVRTFAFA